MLDWSRARLLGSKQIEGRRYQVGARSRLQRLVKSTGTVYFAHRFFQRRAVADSPILLERYAIRPHKCCLNHRGHGIQ